jgi:hypothetical protein
VTPIKAPSLSVLRKWWIRHHPRRSSGKASADEPIYDYLTWVRREEHSRAGRPLLTEFVIGLIASGDALLSSRSPGVKGRFDNIFQLSFREKPRCKWRTGVAVGMVPSELLGANLMFDNDTELLVAIFQKVFRLEERFDEVDDNGEIKCTQLDTVRYTETYKTQIAAAGQMFAYLGLAKPDTQSPLGWRPAPILLEIIAEKVARRPRLIDRMVNDEDTLTISLLCDAVFGDLTDHSVYTTGLGFHVLCALGLLRVNRCGETLPTPELRQIFSDAYGALPWPTWYFQSTSARPASRLASAITRVLCSDSICLASSSCSMSSDLAQSPS